MNIHEMKYNSNWFRILTKCLYLTLQNKNIMLEETYWTLIFFLIYVNLDSSNIYIYIYIYACVIAAKCFYFFLWLPIKSPLVFRLCLKQINANTMDFLQTFASSIYHPVDGTSATLVACMFIFEKLVWDNNFYQVNNNLNLGIHISWS
jgi:hypothetical protein